MVKLRKGEGVKCPCCLHLSVSQNQWRPEHRVSVATPFQGGTRHGSIHFGSVSLCVYVDTVILGRVSPGSAGSAHWTKSSSGGQPESHPSYPIHYKEDRKNTEKIGFINDIFREINLSNKSMSCKCQAAAEIFLSKILV